MKFSRIFLLRAALGAAIAWILMRGFYPSAHWGYTFILWTVLVACAYVFERFRNP
ncbi:hypothetical protein [Desulfatirhabdium butyrativorans]|uniref:hypothetical protein n=1 Tax=Desulfatirhabdium butyrativorans TaxID=340467 RepID=UPI0003F86AA6|nr:hypothetical protein [Desulfatirhabdium butyrativorans]